VIQLDIGDQVCGPADRFAALIVSLPPYQFARDRLGLDINTVIQQKAFSAAD